MATQARKRVIQCAERHKVQVTYMYLVSFADGSSSKPERSRPPEVEDNARKLISHVRWTMQLYIFQTTYKQKANYRGLLNVLWQARAS